MFISHAFSFQFGSFRSLADTDDSTIPEAAKATYQVKADREKGITRGHSYNSKALADEYVKELTTKVKLEHVSKVDMSF